MIKFNFINVLGPQLFYTTDNHLLYQILQETDSPADNEEFISLLEEQIGCFLSLNQNIKSDLYYKLNSKSNNTKVLISLEEDVKINFKWTDGKNDFLSSTSFEMVMEQKSLFILPSSVDFDCESDSIYSLDLEITKNKKFKKLTGV